jgi:hypothetical protein
VREEYALNLDRLRKEREPIIDQCKKFGDNEEPCSRIDGVLCSAYVSPKAKWRLGACPLATHVIERVGDQTQGKVRVGQQKQKRRKK